MNSKHPYKNGFHTESEKPVDPAGTIAIVVERHMSSLHTTGKVFPCASLETAERRASALFFDTHYTDKDFQVVKAADFDKMHHSKGLRD